MAKTESKQTARAVSYYIWTQAEGRPLGYRQASIRYTAKLHGIAPSTLTRALNRRKAKEKA